MRRLGVFALAVAAVASAFVAVPAAPAAAYEPAAITWEKCRTYSDKELDGQRHGHNLEALKREVARRQCGTLAVPLDYSNPGGRQLKIAVTRYRATGKRLGVLAVNPGGPGGSGVLLPADVSRAMSSWAVSACQVQRVTVGGVVLCRVVSPVVRTLGLFSGSQSSTLER